MLERSEIDGRLRQMRRQANPGLRWDEQCDGSARALVLFVGPSAGTNPRDPKVRRPRRRNHCAALWNESYIDPLSWAPGFRTSFAPLVEALLSISWPRASKLIARGNLDWYGNPEAVNVPEEFMHKGAPSVLRMISDCAPDLVVPMEKRAFWVLRDAMAKAGYTIGDCEVKEFKVRISDASKVRLNRKIYCFRATSLDGHKLVVIKLPQHPAKVLQADYGTRCGLAVRTAALQIAAGQPVDVRVT